MEEVMLRSSVQWQMSWAGGVSMGGESSGGKVVLTVSTRLSPSTEKASLTAPQ